MTEKNLSIAAPRCAFNVWKYVHWGNAHRTNHQTNQPTNGRYMENHACANSTPFSAPSTPHCQLLPFSSSLDLFLPSHPFRPLLLRCSRPLLHLSPTATASACIGANLSLDREFFRDSFRPESIPPPRQSQTVGAAAAGVRRVQPSVLRLNLVSLVTAPHKGIAL